MTPVRFQPDLPRRERTTARAIIEAVLRAADPARALKAHLRHLPPDTPTHILAFGKASVAMTAGAVEHLGSSFARATVLAPEAVALNTQFKSKLVETLPCDHPLPTQRNIDATRTLLEHARSIPEDHRVLVLISGGASAMLCMPRPRVTLAEIRQTTRDMLARGASIAEINAVRTRMETLKGGGLARELSHVRDIRCYLLSDVIGDDPSVIASGPMHDAHPPRTPHTIIAGNNTALDALHAWCARTGVVCAHTRRAVVDQAADAGEDLARRLLDADEDAPADTPVAVALGGEPVVDTHGAQGVGGPMLELGLACALVLAETDLDLTVLTLTTDGIDGPSEAAGMVITGSMLRERTRDAREALERHDTRPICDTLGATFFTGPTGTNINDIAIAIRWNQTARA